MCVSSTHFSLLPRVRSSPSFHPTWRTFYLHANHGTHRFGKGITSRYRFAAYNISFVGSSIKGGIKRAQLPAPPSPMPTGHTAFREDRLNGTVQTSARGIPTRARGIIPEDLGSVSYMCGTGPCCYCPSHTQSCSGTEILKFGPLSSSLFCHYIPLCVRHAAWTRGHFTSISVA